jgi:hypothetical protein
LQLTASDDDNSVLVDFNILIKNQFFVDSIEQKQLKFNYDEDEVNIEYPNRPLRVVGDIIETHLLKFAGNSILNFSPMVLTRPYFAKPI